jgi:hypothetical protein
VFPRKVKEINTSNPFVKEKGMADRAWGGHVCRYLMTASRKTQNFNSGRAQKLNRFFVNGFFSKLMKQWKN